MDAVLFACLSGALIGGLNVAIRAALRRTPDVGAMSVVTTIVGLLATIVLVATFSSPIDGLHLGELWPFFAIGVFVPGMARLLYVRALKDAGSARTGILLATSPLLSALIAIAVLGEPLRAGLAAGTVLIVGGAIVLAWEDERPADFKLLGAALALVVAFMVGVRDNVARWATGETGVEPVVAIAAVLLAGTVTMLLYFQIESRGKDRVSRLRRVFLPSLPIGLLTSMVSLLVLVSLDRGPVTVVAPLIATHALWVVGLSALLTRRSEAVGRQLVLAAIFVVVGAGLIGVTQ